MMKGLASDFSINGGKVERETYGTSDVALGGKGAARCLERDMFYTLALDSRRRAATRWSLSPSTEWPLVITRRRYCSSGPS